RTVRDDPCLAARLTSVISLDDRRGVSCKRLQDEVAICAFEGSKVREAHPSREVDDFGTRRAAWMECYGRALGKDERVHAESAVCNGIAATADQGVVADASVESVCTSPTFQDITASSPNELLGASASHQGIRISRPNERIVTVPTTEGSVWR